LSFWDSLFKKKKTEPEHLEPHEVGCYLEERLGEERKQTYDKAHPIIQKLMDCISRMDSLTTQIEQSSIPEDTAVKLKRIAKTSKPSFVTGIREAINPFQNKNADYYTDLKNTHKQLREMLDSLARVHLGQGRYLPVIFEDEVKEIKKESKKMLELCDRLEVIVSELGDAGIVEETYDKYNRLKSCGDEIHSIASLLNEKNKRMNYIIIEKKRSEDEINKHMQSDEARELASKKKQIDELDDKINGLESKIFHLITPLKRSMKKYRKQAFEPDKSTIKRIDGYIDEPVKQFIKDDNDSLRQLMTRLEAYVAEDKIKLKDKEKRKTRDKISNLLETDINALREEYNKALEEKTKINKLISESNVLEEKNKLKSDLESTVSELNLIREEIKTLEDKNKSLLSEKQDLRGELQKKLSEIKENEIKIRWS